MQKISRGLSVGITLVIGAAGKAALPNASATCTAPHPPAHLCTRRPSRRQKVYLLPPAHRELRGGR